MGIKRKTIGCGKELKKYKKHPYIGRAPVNMLEVKKILKHLNSERENSRGPHIEVDYYFEAVNTRNPLDGLEYVTRMVLEHGTVKPWHSEGDTKIQRPPGYNENMSWVVDIKLLGYNRDESIESGIVTIAYPLAFFDKSGGAFPMAQLMMAVASEPVSAFSNYQAAKMIDIRFPTELKRRLPGILWPHKRIVDYLNLPAGEPIIGTIVKPKTGLTPELFSRAVTEAAVAGARFTKADENMHLTLKELPIYVSKTVKSLERAGFDLGSSSFPKRKRFLFAPHITADPKNMMEYAKAAVEAGANALMFSPYYSGGFLMLTEIAKRFDVPIYAHTAGMNIFTGSPFWGIDSRVMYLFSAYFGAAFMQLPAVKGYIRPDDIEKKEILKRLKEENLEGNEGMTLVIAGGVGPGNIGLNMKILGTEGRMFLAGTSVYSHPDGVSAGVKALILAYHAYKEAGITEIKNLINYGKNLGKEGYPLVRALVHKLK